MPIDPKKLRKARGERPQSEFAAAAKMTQPAYARVEGGNRPDPKLSTAERIAKAAGVKVDDLLH